MWVRLSRRQCLLRRYLSSFLPLPPPHVESLVRSPSPLSTLPKTNPSPDHTRSQWYESKKVLKQLFIVFLGHFRSSMIHTTLSSRPRCVLVLQCSCLERGVVAQQPLLSPFLPPLLPNPPPPFLLRSSLISGIPFKICSVSLPSFPSTPLCIQRRLSKGHVLSLLPLPSLQAECIRKYRAMHAVYRTLAKWYGIVRYVRSAIVQLAQPKGKPSRI